ncbi:mannosyltransferase putative-domain-containing protein [Blyttiomyces helicus]|uniref:Mannosyltransferase putative-domain-containing protein n=1 Tax=Blyttiomyces helicus TaxID=388810 RepID=A0A4P9W2X9_9FUNG|nr:mannosyltransferase putative-domain-containing protein [Blyttiomyces helicus]|eukprot:RKO86629.1 mannosyltransferase putative-domain-containing protein [Blyttiomyces helicus]
MGKPKGASTPLVSRKAVPIDTEGGQLEKGRPKPKPSRPFYRRYCAITGFTCFLLFCLWSYAWDEFRFKEKITSLVRSRGGEDVRRLDPMGVDAEKEPVYLSGPCKPSNNKLQLHEPKFEDWTDDDIDAHRRDWQQWITQDFPRRPSYEELSRRLAQNGLPAMEGRGIVIYGSRANLKWMNTTISFLHSYGTRLPIEIWSFANEVSGSGDRAALEGLSRPGIPVRVRTVEDEGNIFRMTRGRSNGWHIKVPALLNCGFREVLALDMDNVPIVDPTFLFDSPEFRKKGAMFWPDYWKTHSQNPVWRWMGAPCVDEWEQESGMILIDKERSWKALNLLWYIERDDAIRKWHEFLHGDKDLYRFAFRATETPVYWVPHLVTPGGFVAPDDQGNPRFCGLCMVQHAPSGNPIFAHCNLLKYANHRLFNATHPPLSVIKRYKPLPAEWLPVGPELGTRMMWGDTRGAHAGLISAHGMTCVDIFTDKMDGVERQIEMDSLEKFNPAFGERLYGMVFG